MVPPNSRLHKIGERSAFDRLDQQVGIDYLAEVCTIIRILKEGIQVRFAQIATNFRFTATARTHYRFCRWLVAEPPPPSGFAATRDGSLPSGESICFARAFVISDAIGEQGSRTCSGKQIVSHDIVARNGRRLDAGAAAANDRRRSADSRKRGWHSRYSEAEALRTMKSVCPGCARPE